MSAETGMELSGESSEQVEGRTGPPFSGEAGHRPTGVQTAGQPMVTLHDVLQAGRQIGEESGRSA
jgi:hypothetical protein